MRNRPRGLACDNAASPAREFGGHFKEAEVIEDSDGEGNNYYFILERSRG